MYPNYEVFYFSTDIFGCAEYHAINIFAPRNPLSLKIALKLKPPSPDQTKKLALIKKNRFLCDLFFGIFF